MRLFSQATSGEYIYLLLYVDDILIAFSNRSLSSEFKMMDLGEVKEYCVWRLRETG